MMPKLPPTFANLSFQKSSMPLNRRRRQPDQDGSNEIWLLTMSDMMMLLMIFFILFFTITYARHATPAPAPVLAETEMDKQIVEPVLQTVEPVIDNALEQISIIAGLQTDLQNTLGERHGEQGVIVERRSQYIVLTFPEQIVFDSGQAELKISVQSVLQTVADFIDRHPELSLEIQGHTDNRPISNRSYPSNWELSAARATQVARALVALGVHPPRITAKGFGEYHPVSANDSDEGRLQNRRVEIQFSVLQAEG
jgi:chemotaxis protein MotB